MSGRAAPLYDEDFVRWTEEQSGALRNAARVGRNLPLDWENLDRFPPEDPLPAGGRGRGEGGTRVSGRVRGSGPG